MIKMRCKVYAHHPNYPVRAHRLGTWRSTDPSAEIRRYRYIMIYPIYLDISFTSSYFWPQSAAPSSLLPYPPLQTVAAGGSVLSSATRRAVFHVNLCLRLFARSPPMLHSIAVHDQAPSNFTMLLMLSVGSMLSVGFLFFLSSTLPRPPSAAEPLTPHSGFPGRPEWPTGWPRTRPGPGSGPSRMGQTQGPIRGRLGLLAGPRRARLRLGVFGVRRGWIRGLPAPGSRASPALSPPSLCWCVYVLLR
jgi:hypothetical protein